MRAAPEIVFEDMVPGAVSTFGPTRVPRDEMIAFAREFDPQPFHLDEAAAAATPVRQLIASGWYTSGLQMRMLCEGWLTRASILGGLGIDELRWLRPVVAGDLLTLRQTVLDTRISGSRPDRGVVRLAMELANARGETVMTVVHVVLMGLRGAATPAPPVPPPLPPEPPELCPAEDTARAPRDYDDVEIGRGVDLGAYTFTPERIVAFARLYDPQDFHLDPQAARTGPFGGLAASGWHTASAWMGRLAHRLDRLRETGGPPRIGVSPGYRDLRWLRPVYAGETIRFASEPIAKRPLASRPGWGLVSSRNSGWNGRGEKVFAFEGSAFWALRDAPDAVLMRDPAAG